MQHTLLLFLLSITILVVVANAAIVEKEKPAKRPLRSKSGIFSRNLVVAENASGGKKRVVRRLNFDFHPIAADQEASPSNDLEADIGPVRQLGVRQALDLLEKLSVTDKKLDAGPQAQAPEGSSSSSSSSSSPSHHVILPEAPLSSDDVALGVIPEDVEAGNGHAASLVVPGEKRKRAS